MNKKDDNMYKQYTELPTILWIFGMFGIALSSLLVSNVVTGSLRMFMMSVGIVSGSLGLTIFIVVLLYPLAKDVLFPKKNKDKSDDEIF